MKRYRTFESVESEETLKNLAQIICKHLGQRLSSAGKNLDIFTRGLSLRFDDTAFLRDVQNYFAGAKASAEAQNVYRMVRANPDFCVWLKGNDETTAGAGYRKDHTGIIVYFNHKKWETYCGTLDQSGTAEEYANALYLAKQGSLTHELTHMYDFFIDADAVQDFDSDSYVRAKDDQDEYLAQDAEVSARYTELVTSPAMERIKSEEPWDVYMKEFKDRMEGWSVLSKETQQGLLGRLKKRYTNN